MTKIYTAFPDIVIEGNLALTAEIETQLNNAILAEADSGSVEETNFGFRTNEYVPLNDTLKKLQQLVLNSFFKDIAVSMPSVKNTKTNIELVRPNLISIKPMSNLPASFKRNRFYTGCVWLQTTNKGSHVYIESPTAKKYSTAEGLMDYNIFIKPAKFKYAFWPAHLRAGFTPNNSMTNTVAMQFSFTVAVPWDGRPAPLKK